MREAQEYIALQEFIENCACVAICHPGEAKAARRAINGAMAQIQLLRKG